MPGFHQVPPVVDVPVEPVEPVLVLEPVLDVELGVVPVVPLLELAVAPCVPELPLMLVLAVDVLLAVALVLLVEPVDEDVDPLVDAPQPATKKTNRPARERVLNGSSR